MKLFFLKPRAIMALVIVLLCSNVLEAQTENGTDLYDLSLEELMNMNITLASKKSESSFESPLATTVISHDEIVQSGATTIEEALRLVPGFIVRQESNGNYDVHIRGNDNVPPGGMTFMSENTMTLVMINNRKVYNYANGGTFWESLPISINDIDRIEIVRGPSTALYGPNAVSGVINIVTSKPEAKSVSVAANAQAGTENTGLYDFTVGSSLNDNKLKLQLGGNYEKRDRYSSDYYNWVQGDYVSRDEIRDYRGNLVPDIASKYSNVNLAKERSGINGLAEYQFNDNVNVSFEGSYQNSYAQTVFMESQETPLTGRSSETYSYNITSKIYGFDVQVAGLNGDNDIYEGSGTSKYDVNTFDANLEYSLEMNKLTVRPGMSYQSAVYSDLAYAGGENLGYLNAERELNSVAGFVRGDYKATDKLRFIAALRYDKYNVPNDGYLTYQLIGTYQLNDKNMIRLSYSKANRGATMLDSYADYTRPYVVFEGNQDIKLATMNNYEIGYRVKPVSNLLVELEAFHSSTTNFSSFELEEGSSIDFVQMNNDMESSQYGASLNLNWVISKKYQFRTWVTYMESNLNNMPEKTVDANGFVVSTGKTIDMQNINTPDFFGGCSFTAKPVDKLIINADVYYLGESIYRQEYYYYTQVGAPGSGQTTVDSKATFNLKASYQLTPQLNVFVNGRNIFDNNQAEFGFADPIGGLYLAGLSFKL